MDEDRIWKAVSTAAAVGAGMALRPLVAKLWQAGRRQEPPANPAARSVTWPEALAWSAFSGAVVGIIRMVAQRLAAEGWRKAQGDYPPGMRQRDA